MTDSMLLVHDDPSVLRAIGARFEETGHEVIRELSVEAGVANLARIRPDVVLLAAGLADSTSVRSLAGEAPVIIFGDHLEPGIAQRGADSGAFQVIDTGGDLANLPRLASSVARIAKQRRAIAALMAAAGSRHGVDSLGASPTMKQIANQIGLLAQSDRTTLLIRGEFGVGKAWAARTIHDLSGRASKPFLEIRCTGMNATYLDSLLFGHEKGVFVEAAERRRGLMEIADGGTVLLREIGDLPAEIQPKLLRALETRAFRRLGGDTDISFDTRLMVTTRRDLSQDVEAERFREDLFYRLSVIPLGLPALKERTADDRFTLITAIHEDLRADFNDAPSVFSPEALERFQSYPWPGNVRELINVIERAVMMSKGQPMVNVEHLPNEFRARAGIGDRRHTPMTLESLEQQHIERTLRYHGGNRTRAAKELGISRATLINKIKLYNIAD